MKLKKISILFIINVILLINLIPVSANQISVIGGATNTTTSQQSVNIPNGDYHVYIEASGDLAGIGVAFCNATNGTTTVFFWSTTLDTDNWSGQVTFHTSIIITFKFEIQTSYANALAMNFQIIFTDLDVATITKTGIIAEAPYGLDVIGLALIGLVLFYIRKRGNKK